MNERKQALEFLQTVRGQYIIGQELYIASKTMLKEPELKREFSNITDMEFLMDNLFPMYKISITANELNIKGEKNG